MSVVLVKHKSFSRHKRAASEDARHLLLKGFVNNLSWSAAVHSVATTLLNCDYEDLLSPQLYFTREQTLRSAINQTSALNWYQWVQWVEAAILIKDYQTSFPTKAKQVLDAVDWLQSTEQPISKQSLEKAYLELQNKGSNPASISLAPISKKQADKKKAAKLLPLTIDTTPCDNDLAWDKAQQEITQLKTSLKLTRNAFKALDKRAKSKLTAREDLSKKLLRYLSLVAKSRSQLRLENHHLVIAFSIAFAAAFIQLVI